VIVPDDVDVDVDAQAAVGGDIWVDGESENGPSPQVRTQIDGGDDVPDITLDINLGAGSIRVSQEEAA
jgi:hypothetical protein